MKNDGCYIEDFAVKSHDKRNHLDDLRTMFDIMQTQQLKMNPTKFFSEPQVLNSLDSSSRPKESTSTLIKSRLSRECNLQRLSKSSDRTYILKNIHIFCILFITLLHLSCNKSANFLVLNVYFA